MKPARFFTHFSVILSLIPLLSACAPADAPKVDDRSRPENIQSSLFKDAGVECADPRECPSHTGMLVIQESTDFSSTSYSMSRLDHFSVCAAFLLDEQTLVSNTRCIPGDLRPSANASANPAVSQRLKIYFPKTASLPAESAAISEVVSVVAVSNVRTADEILIRPDVAILRLDHPVQRRVPQLNRSGLLDGTEVSAAVVHPMSSTSARGLIQIRKCHILQRSVAVPGFVDALHDVGVLSDCQVTGNDVINGSPVMTQNGDVIAVAHGSVNPKASKDFTSKSSVREPLAFVTNLACTKVGDAFQPTAGCSSEGPDSIKKLVATLSETASLRDVQPSFEAWRKTAPRAFAYGIAKMPADVTNRLVVTPRIDCVNPIRSWVKPEDFVGPNKVSVAVRASLWTIVSSVQPNSRVVAQVKDADPFTIRLTFDPAVLEKTGHVVAIGTSSAPVTQIELELCQSL